MRGGERRGREGGWVGGERRGERRGREGGWLVRGWGEGGVG